MSATGATARLLHRPEVSSSIPELAFSTADDARALLSSRPGRFYVYALGWPEGGPFYVGKGSAAVGNVQRLFHHSAEARLTALRTHKLNIIRKIARGGGEVRYALCAFFDGEAEAHAHERGLILRIGRHDLGTGPLANQTDGGEGTCNPSQESLDRRLATLGGRSDDPERRRINEFFVGIGGAQPSVPVKPLRSWTRAEPLTASVKRIWRTERMARAVVASAAANGVLLAPDAVIPRLLTVEGIEYLIENGCGREMIAAGVVDGPLASTRPRDETMRLTDADFRHVLSCFDARRLVDLGVLDPGPGTGVCGA